MHKFKLLLVEDEHTHTRLFERKMRRAELDADLDIVADGQAALEYLVAYAKNPDIPLIVVLDIKLPVLNGVQVLQKIRGNPALRDLPVIVLTTSDQEAEVEACKALGAVAYLIKPVDFDTLVSHINGIMLEQ